MKLAETAEKLGLLKVTEKFENKEVTGCYIGDLLSHVMGKAGAGNLWITIMNNINIVAVASLCEVSAIVLCEDVDVSDAVARKAADEGVAIFKSPLSAYELAGKVREIL